jgi:hypothetical protein
MSKNIEIKIIVGINNYENFEINIFEIDYFFNNTNTAPGGVGHALTIHSILDKMSNSSTGLFLDVDTAFLTRCWDVVFINEIKDDCVAFGTSHQKNEKFLSFPNIVACSFDIEKIKNLKIDFSPFSGNPEFRYKISTSLESKAWGKAIGQNVVLDTGYQFPLKVIEAGYKGKVIPCQKNSALGVGQEFHYNGAPFISHMKGSSGCDKEHPKTKNGLLM